MHVSRYTLWVLQSTSMAWYVLQADKEHPSTCVELYPAVSSEILMCECRSQEVPQLKRVPMPQSGHGLCEWNSASKQHDHSGGAAPEAEQAYQTQPQQVHHDGWCWHGVEGLVQDC